MTIGGKYKQEINTNPAPGAYDVERADSITKFRSPIASIKEERNSFANKGRLQLIDQTASNPSPGQYEGNLNSFGSKSGKFTIGLKREEKIPLSPGPGDFDTDASFNITKGSIKGGPYITNDNDYLGKNSFNNMSMDSGKITTKYSNKYIFKNMSPDSKTKVMNMDRSKVMNRS